MNESVPESWSTVLEPVLATPDSRRLGGWLKAEEEAGRTIYPPRGQRLSALELTPLDKVKVVILGQDPYHGPGQAHGLSFSVPEGVKLPPSLRNIYKELASDLGITPANNGNLERWARQGVLLLNNSLTVEASKAGSHAGRGWDAITDACVAAVAASEKPTVFILWGSHAQKKSAAHSRTCRTIAPSCHCQRPPQPAFGPSRLFRFAPVQPRQCVSARTRPRSDRVVA